MTDDKKNRGFYLQEVKEWKRGMRKPERYLVTMKKKIEIKRWKSGNKCVERPSFFI